MTSELGRMMDKDREPSDDEILSHIGSPAEEAWTDLEQFLQDNYEFTPEKVFYGKKYGWTVRYRKSGKTLCSLFPEKDGFTVLIVLGRKEAMKVDSIRDELSPGLSELIGSTEQLHDGRWLWMSVHGTKDTDDIKRILQTKRRPKRV
ncbi:MAG: DUF3788 domain-containing protein [Candidatus Thorarchaeota archaeon]|jgi:hypothetical protein